MTGLLDYGALARFLMNPIQQVADPYSSRKIGPGLLGDLGMPTEGARAYQGGANRAIESIDSPALQYGGKIYTGYNHSDALESAARATGHSFNQIAAKAKEGFTTSEGRFVNRMEAGKIDDALRGVKSEYYR